MKVSIITVCLNSKNLIIKNLLSVNNQSYSNIEHIIIDGGSTDGTLEVIKNNKTKPGLIVSEKDNGIYNALNKGLKNISGDIVFFLAADDILANSDIISRVVNEFNDDTEIIYGNIEYIDHNKNLITKRKIVPGNYKKNLFLSGWHPAAPAIFYRKECFQKYGNFNESLEISSDFELLLRFMDVYEAKNKYINLTFTYMGIGGKSMILKNIIIGNLNILKAFKLHNKNIYSIIYLIRRLFPKLLNSLKNKIK